MAYHSIHKGGDLKVMDVLENNGDERGKLGAQRKAVWVGNS